MSIDHNLANSRLDFVLQNNIMPSIEENLRAWQSVHDWSQDGDEWSEAWGGSEAQWFAEIYPRIHTFLPARRVLEIAPGFGRWTRFLKNSCESLSLVDLTPACIDACRKRFRADSHILYHLNDGKSLDMIPDRSLDFVFSFDSLVHVESDVIEGYLLQLAKKLTVNGVGFIHHSNIGTFTDPRTGRLPFQNVHWRAESMTSKLFEQFCAKANLLCINQELINWPSAGGQLIDCFSIFTTEGSIWARPNIVIANDKFGEEAQYIRRLAEGYIFRPSAPPATLE